MRLRVATFNVENLSARWRFAEAQRGESAAALSLADFPHPRERQAAERSLALTLEDDKRQMTALAIAEARADILCLQEVDSLRVLDAFFANYVHRVADIRYGHFALVEGNDRRGIDVAFACRRTLPSQDVRVTSHAAMTFADLDVWDREVGAFGIRREDRVFNRDCLMVDVDMGKRALTLFVVHLKSMNNGKDDGRSATMPLRRAEARAVRRIVEQRFGPGWRDAPWVIAGDLNDYTQRVVGEGLQDAGACGIDPLLDRFAVNPVDRLPAKERWTHFHRAWSEERGDYVSEHVQLDYVLLSPALAASGDLGVEIIRRGLPYRVPLDPAHPDRSVARLSTTADRYPRVGWDRPKASDHCPLVVEFTLPKRGGMG
ncbi:endonuclease/exonuclease/phosphatase family protein [Alsobacter sp. R-9]